MVLLKRKHKRKEVVLLKPNKGPILTAISDGLVKALSRSGMDMHVNFMNANEDYESFGYRLDELLEMRDNIDLIYSIGNRCTQAIKNKTEEKGKLVPIVFGAVQDPKGFGLVHDDVYSGNHLTGISANGDGTYNTEFATALCKIPNIHRVLLFYDASFKESCKRTRVLEKLLTQRGKLVKAVAIDVQTRVAEIINSISTSIDLIAIMRETHMEKQFDELAQIVKNQRIPAFCADSVTVERGIPFGYSINETKVGTQTAKHGLSILAAKNSPQECKIKPLNAKYKLFVSKKAGNALNMRMDFLGPMKNKGIEYV